MKKFKSVTTVDEACIIALVIAFCASAAGAETNDRATRWAQRESPQAIRESSERFVEMLGFRSGDRGGVLTRLELRLVTDCMARNDPVAATEAFYTYFLRKLRCPRPYGISAEFVNPFEGGPIDGKFPVAPFDPGADRANVIAAADKLMSGLASVQGKEVNLGAPGSVNWNYPFAPGEAIPVEKMPPAEVWSGQIFWPLAHAYVLTHDEHYLNRWVGYLDDWSLNSTYVDSIQPCLVPDSTSLISLPVEFFRVMGGLVAATASDRRLMPPRVFSQVVHKLLLEGILPHIVYMRSNPHNWTPHPWAMLDALLFDEFKVSRFFFRESLRRNVEDNAVTQNLRDGTETQQDPWYNAGGYMDVRLALKWLDDRNSLPIWSEPAWVADRRNAFQWRNEIQEHLREHVTYLIHLRTPQDEWPIPFRGGDKRVAQRGEYGASPDAYADPENLAILSATEGAGDRKPSFDSEWFPYGGYNIVRSGWGKLDACGAMFTSPQPGSYGGFRSRSNNNTFGLGAFGQDLLIDDCVGHYMHVGSPILVDDKSQFFHARDGVYRVGAPAAHKATLVSAWTEPAPWRWHASDRLNLMEGIYAGPWGDLRLLEKVTAGGAYGPESHPGALTADLCIQGVTHQRLVQYVRKAAAWIVTDRLTSDTDHRYKQLWMLPIKPSKGNLTAYDPGEIKLDESDQVITATATDQVPANVSLRQFSTFPLKYSRRDVSNDPKNSYQKYARAEIAAEWKGAGTTQVVTLVRPSPVGDTDLQSPAPLKDARGAVGFTAQAPSGPPIQYLASPRPDCQLTLGDVNVIGESLLIAGDCGMALGCKSMTIAGKTFTPETEDFEFELKDGLLGQITPIYRPIDPVVIGPQQNIFVNDLEITMASRTAGVELRYTLDGTEPTPQSALFTGPLKVTQSAVVKARAYRTGVTHNPPQSSGTHATATSTAVFDKATWVEPLSVAKVLPGLRCRYWQDDWKKLWLSADSLAPAATGLVPGLFDLSLIPAGNPSLGQAPAPRKKYFAVEYSGYLDVPADGVYTIHAPRELIYPDTDAGYELRVYLGASKKNNGDVYEWYPATRLHAFGNWSIALKRGLHPLNVFYLDYRTDTAQRLNKPGLRPYIWPGSTPDLRISGPGIDKQPIPPAWLNH